ncbi:MAG: hypothetical protein K940chlam2_01380 [Chlamydiae bacterium]|nr:hypothetical protein [Chlamydiota bacterium]
MKTLLALTGITSALCAAETCCESAPAVCYPDSPLCAYCVGPDSVNPSVRPLSCDGSWLVTLEGLYWNSHQDGMEFAIDNSVFVRKGDIPAVVFEQLNNLIDAEYLNPHAKWGFGFKAGLTYNSTHDGWDIGVTWTWYQGRASSHIEAETDDNHTLIPLWSAYQASNISILWARDIEAHWSMRLNLADVELGREFWVSKYLTLRPHVGIRFASIDQDYTLWHKGGLWTLFLNNGEVNMRNDFHGVGGRGGFNTIWKLGKGVSFFGNTALSLVYGRFNVKHDEWNTRIRAPQTKTRILEADDHFRATRAMTDLALGMQW